MKKYLYGGVVSLAVLTLVVLSGGVKTASAHGFVPHFLSINYALVTDTSATLYATVDSMHSSDGGHAWFEYGTNPDSGSYQTSWGNKAGIRSLPHQGWTFMITKISGLKPNTTYYFHVKAENRNGSNTGETVSFRTKPANQSNNSCTACDPQQNVYTMTNNTSTINTNITTTVNNTTTNYTYQNNYQSTGNQDTSTTAVYTYHY